MYIVGAVVKMSSQHQCTSGYCFNESKAVDGIYTLTGLHEYTSIAHTLHQNNPWIQIDLGTSLCIAAVKIWNFVTGEISYMKFESVIAKTAINSS